MAVKRILVIPGRISGGVGSVVMNLFRSMNEKKVHYDFCVSESDAGIFDREIEAKGSKVFRVPRIQKIGPFRFIKEVKEVLINNGPYDGVHIHSVHMGALALIAAKQTGVKLRLYHVHSTKDAALEKVPFHQLLEFILSKIIIRNSTVKLACGKEAGKYVYGNNRFTVIHNAIDLNRFTILSQGNLNVAKAELAIPDGSVIVGNVANFSPVKNMKFFLRLAEEDKEKKNKCFFLLVGDGDEFDEIKKEICKRQLEDKFVLTGKRFDTETFYNLFDVFCLPSLFEGLPVTVIEAQACGLPIITSTSVTKEANLGISSYTRIDLNAPISNWLSQIYAVANKKCCDALKIKKTFIANKYNIDAVCEDVGRVYCETDLKECC